MIDTHQLAWAAGFFDGEGSTGYEDNGGSGIVWLRINQTHPAVLWRFWLAVHRIGVVRGPYQYRNRPNDSRFWCYQLQRLEDVQAVMAMIWRYLSRLKREQYALAVRKYLDRRKYLESI